MSSCLSGLRASFSESDSLRAILAAKRPVETEESESESFGSIICYSVHGVSTRRKMSFHGINHTEINKRKCWIIV